MGRKFAMSVFVTLAACAIGASVGNANPLEGIWQGTYKCGQDRFNVHGTPFEWKLPFSIQDGKITAIREYISLSSQPAVAQFNGLIQGDGLIEIGVNAGVARAFHPAYHGTYTSRVDGARIDFQGPMLTESIFKGQCWANGTSWSGNASFTYRVGDIEVTACQSRFTRSSQS